MEVIYKIHTGRGTLLNPTFRSIDFVQSLRCHKTQRIGSLLYCFNSSGYCIGTVGVDDIIEIK